MDPSSFRNSLNKDLQHCKFYARVMGKFPEDKIEVAFASKNYNDTDTTYTAKYESNQHIEDLRDKYD